MNNQLVHLSFAVKKIKIIMLNNDEFEATKYTINDQGIYAFGVWTFHGTAAKPTDDGEKMMQFVPHTSIRIATITVDEVKADSPVPEPAQETPIG